MGNPFRPGNGIMPPYLAGREGEMRWFESSLVSALSFPQNLVLSGIRGTGKTVLLRKFECIWMGPGITKYILIVGLNFFIKGLEKRIREDEAIATAITMLRESLKQNRKPILI